MGRERCRWGDQGNASRQSAETLAAPVIIILLHLRIFVVYKGLPISAACIAAPVVLALHMVNKRDRSALPIVLELAYS